jgi:hypothetical protein
LQVFDTSRLILGVIGGDRVVVLTWVH